jgi:hypothetical protein
MKHRRAAKIDSNQNDIVTALRDIPGVSVKTGVDDILVGFRGCNYWFEIKSPDKVNIKTGRIYNLKGSQKTLLETWRGQYNIAWSLEQILKTIGVT